MKILVIDDDPVAIQILGNCLSNAGFSDLTCVTSAEAGELHIRDKSQHFDCFLLDISMPNKTGIEICGDIRRTERYRYTPILMITRLAERNSIEAAFHIGATDYITKPFEEFEVIARINIAQRLLSERRAALDSFARTSANTAGAHPQIVQQNIADLIDSDGAQLQEKNLLPMYNFKNYLEGIIRTDDCCVDVIGIRIENIGKYFTSMDRNEFIAFLGTFVDSVREYSQIRKVFLTHVGDGIFVCAADNIGSDMPDGIERGIMNKYERRMTRALRRHGADLEITVSQPLHLTTASRPNFNRLLKVIRTRTQVRYSEKVETMSIAS